LIQSRKLGLILPINQTSMRYFKLSGFVIFLCSFLFLVGASQKRVIRMKKPVDTVGFATKAWQMDSIMNRIKRLQGHEKENALRSADIDDRTTWKAVICPHDDYTYVGWLYPAVLQNVKANTIIFFGVAHKAKQFKIENNIVFDAFDKWAEPYGPVAVSGLRNEIIKELPKNTYIIHDSLQQAEHSVEAIIPFLQYQNRKIQIISILVPYMPFSRMDTISTPLSSAIINVMKKHNLEWGKDIAIVISTDAVHYGDEDWGGQNYAPYGCDDDGYTKAKYLESEIINNCLTGAIQTKNIKLFTGYTLKADDYKTYKWTWCGRYSVPFGLLTAMKMQDRILKGIHLKGTLIGYSTSISGTSLPVSGLGMGKTAIANLHHWVGYCGVGYK
jgi:MEMO1 family protein